MILPSPSRAALVALIAIQSVMLAAMLSRVQPHPPFTIPLFGMGPFLGAALAAAGAAIAMRDEQTRAGQLLSALSVLSALVSFGPQKYADASFPQIWPSVIGAQVACIVIAARLVTQFRGLRPGSRNLTRNRD